MVHSSLSAELENFLSTSEIIKLNILGNKQDYSQFCQYSYLIGNSEKCKELKKSKKEVDSD